MVAWINKWFHFSDSLVVFLVAAMINKQPPKGGGGLTDKVHPVHVSVMEVNHNSADKSLEISCKIFTDDFERILAKNYKTKVDLINPVSKAAMDSLMKKYVFSHLQIKINGSPVVFSYLGAENEDAATYVYIESFNIPSASKIDVVTSVMHDQFDDQMNILHITSGGKRKSTKLNYPAKDASFSF